MVTVQNTRLSGAAIEVFVEPVLPAPRVHIVGSTPIAAALERSGPELGLDILAACDTAPDLQDGDLAVIVAAHGKCELNALRRALEAGVAYVGLVASPRRGAVLVEELRENGVCDEHLSHLECPAGLAIDARTPAEIALSILARVIGGAAEEVRDRVDPRYDYGRGHPLAFDRSLFASLADLHGDKGVSEVDA